MAVAQSGGTGLIRLEMMYVVIRNMHLLDPDVRSGSELVTATNLTEATAIGTLKVYFLL